MVAELVVGDQVEFEDRFENVEGLGLAGVQSLDREVLSNRAKAVKQKLVVLKVVFLSLRKYPANVTNEKLSPRRWSA